MQGRVSARSGHTYPPCVACVTMLRERLCVPKPHDFVQTVHAVKSDTSQCTGHGPSSHASVCVRAPQDLPPYWASVATLRLRLCVPPLHETVQLLHLDHADSTQSTGHGLTEHIWIAVKSGHALPP